MHLTLLTVEKNAAPLYRFLSIHLSRQPSSLLPHCFALFSEHLACRVLLEKYGPSLARHAQLKDYTGLIGASCSLTNALAACQVAADVASFRRKSHSAGQLYFNMPARRSFAGLFGV